MQTFLIVVAGAVVGTLLVACLLFLWIKRKVKGIGEALGAIFGAANLPPFRVSLAPAPAPEWADQADVDRAFQGFTAAGYSHCGDFRIPEMDDLCLRSFFHRGLGCFGVLYDHPEVGLFVDLVREHGDGTTTTVSSGPESGMDRPEYAPLVRLEVEVTGLNGVSKLHERLADESQGRAGMPASAADFPHVFVESYTQEMDWRIARGGVTVEEIRRAAALGGQPEPDACAVKLVQTAWRVAIEGFIEEEVRKTWLADSGLGAAEWEELRDRIEVVHEHSVAEDQIDALAWLKIEGTFPDDDCEAEERAVAQARTQLEPLFADGVRDGFARAQRVLPEKRRHQLLASLEAPWPADVYRAPEDADPV